MANLMPRRGDRQGLPNKDPKKGQYTGRYRRDGSSLIRISDGLRLVTGDRGETNNPRLSRFYLVDKTPGKGYLSSLYGNEFDDRTYRYRITWEEDDAHAEIVTLYRVGSRGSGHV